MNEKASTKRARLLHEPPDKFENSYEPTIQHLLQRVDDAPDPAKDEANDLLNLTTDSIGSEMANQFIGSWVLFAFMLLFAAVSSYIARLLFSIFNGFKYNDKSLPWMRSLRKYMLSPVNALLKLMFLWFAVLAFPVAYFAENISGQLEALLVVIESILFILLRVSLFVVLLYATYRFILFLQYLTKYLITEYNIDANSRMLVVEGFNILFVVLIIGVAVGGFYGIFLPFNSVTENTSSIFTIFVDLNFFTATLLLSIAPVIKDYSAGLTVYFDQVYRVGHQIEVPGICKGEVVEFQLRSTLIRSADCSITHLPNGKMFRHPVINYTNSDSGEDTERQTAISVFHLQAKLPQNTGSDLLRKIQQDLAARLQENTLPEFLAEASEGPAFVFVDDSFTLHVKKPIRVREAAPKHRMQTELILLITEVLEKKHLTFSNTFHLVEVSMHPQDTA